MMIHLCIPRQYLYKGVSFEFATMVGPWPLKKDGEPRARAGRGFYAKIGPWLKMTREEQEKFRVGGGCQTVEMK